MNTARNDQEGKEDIEEVEHVPFPMKVIFGVELLPDRFGTERAVGRFLFVAGDAEATDAEDEEGEFEDEDEEAQGNHASTVATSCHDYMI